MTKRKVHLGTIGLAFAFLWLISFLGEDNIFLNMISPVMFGKERSFSFAGWTEKFSDGLLTAAAPLWMTQKEKIDILRKTQKELYPTQEVLKENEDVSQTVSAPVASGQGVVYTPQMLNDYNYFVNQFYAVDSSTYADGLLDAETFYNMDLTMNLTGDEPKILIYHTHSREAFLDSRSGKWEDTVVGLGERLKSELEERYGIKVLHLTDTFDVINGVTDRSAAYTYAEERVRQVLEENPSIKVILDLHRDGVPESTRLVTSINGKETAQLMLLNGLCRTVAGGPIEYLQNEYLTENLAFSFKMQAKAAEYYPDLMRRIYLRSYQYNLHMMPRSLLVECGAQTNTVEEVQNAMPLLADLLYLVLSGA